MSRIGLTFVPEQLFCTSLQSLTIEDCGELSYIPDTSQPHISLKIGSCPKLKCFPRIQGLRRLSISVCGFEVLTKLQLCTSLSQLYIEDCSNLKSLPDLQEFHSLAQLEIYRFRNLKSIPDLRELCFLTTLGIQDCHNIMRLPEGSLKCLKALLEWLGNLYSLKKLRIRECNNLMYLPTTTTRLIRLEELNIWYCSKLMERCTEGSGAEWLKISHIPKISV